MPELCLGQECLNRCLRDRFTIGEQATICKAGLFIFCVQLLHGRQDPSFSFHVFLCKVVDDAEPGVGKSLLSGDHDYMASRATVEPCNHLARFSSITLAHTMGILYGTIRHIKVFNKETCDGTICDSLQFVTATRFVTT